MLAHTVDSRDERETNTKVLVRITARAESFDSARLTISFRTSCTVCGFCILNRH